MMTIDDLISCQCIVFECISGSRAYGLDTPESDTDIKGVYIAPVERFFGFQSESQISGDANNVTYYELGRFFELLCKNNPTALEMLFTPQTCIRKGREFLERIEASRFLSRQCEYSFARYAYGQIKKARGLNKKIFKPMDEEKQTILAFCYTVEGQRSVPIMDWLADRAMSYDRCGLTSLVHMENTYALFYDDTHDRRYHFNGLVRTDAAMELTLSPVPKELEPVALMVFNKNAYSRYCKEYRDYWDWVEQRNEMRFKTVTRHGRNYDSKNMMHTFRLLAMAEEIAVHHTMSVIRPDRDWLLSIKAGDYSYEDLLRQVEERIRRIEQLFQDSLLPEKPDYGYAEKILIQLRREYYTQGH